MGLLQFGYYGYGGYYGPYYAYPDTGLTTPILRIWIQGLLGPYRGYHEYRDTAEAQGECPDTY